MLEKEITQARDNAENFLTVLQTNTEQCGIELAKFKSQVENGHRDQMQSKLNISKLDEEIGDEGQAAQVYEGEKFNLIKKLYDENLRLLEQIRDEKMNQLSGQVTLLKKVISDSSKNHQNQNSK